MPIEKILFPTKFRELAFNALESLLVLKHAGLKEVVLCRVILRDEVGFVPFGGYLKKEEEKIREESRIRFEDWQESLSDMGISSKIVITVGEPIPQILELADTEQVDLIVIGRPKRIGAEESFIGSYTHEFITRVKHPVLASKYTVQYKWQDAMLTKTNERPFEVPFFAADWSEQSEQALRMIESMKGVVRKVIVFHNVDTKASKKDIQGTEEEVMMKLNGYCSQLKSAGIEAEPHLGAGGMLDEILRVSREREASMIIIGNTAKTRFLKDMLHKSLSYQVTKLSELPTLLVP